MKTGQPTTQAGPGAGGRAVARAAGAACLVALYCTASAGIECRVRGTMARDAAAVHLLSRAAFGPTAEEVERVRAMGVRAWVEEQLHPDAIPDPELEARLAAYPALAMTTEELLEAYPPPEPGQTDPERGPRHIRAQLAAARVVRAVHARAQLREVLVDFWANHFSVFAPEGPTRWTIVAYERDAIRPHVLGRFDDLLRAVAQSPAMLVYLDNYRSVAPGSRGPGSGINENYARELMELHTLGVDGGYTQDDVVAVAETLTGWTITPRRWGTIDFLYVPRWHESRAQVVLGASIPTGQMEQGVQVLDLLASHRSTARFIAGKLVRRFVADEPPARLVERAAAAFEDSGGDLRVVVREILTAPEFDRLRVRGAKVRTPLEFVAAALRAVSADVRDGAGAAHLVGLLGQPIFAAHPPTGWPEEAEKILSAGGMLTRFRAAYAIAAGVVPGVEVDTAQWKCLLEGRRGTDRLLRRLLFRRPSVATRRALRDAQRSGATPELLAGLALASPEFQQQ